MNVLLVSRYGERLVLPAQLVNMITRAGARRRPWALTVQDYWRPVASG